MATEKEHEDTLPDDVPPEAEASAHTPADAAEEDTPPDEVTEMAEVAAKAEEYQENWLRTAAELQNLQKRLVRDKDLARRMAVRDLVRSLLPCFDNLERAVQSADTSSPEVLIQGVSMVSGEITRILSDGGVAVIAPSGERLDPTRHEAVSSRPDAEVEENLILEVHEKGYALGEMIIRPARVTVSLGPPTQTDETPDGSDADAGEDD